MDAFKESKISYGKAMVIVSQMPMRKCVSLPDTCFDNGSSFASSEPSCELFLKAPAEATQPNKVIKTLTPANLMALCEMLGGLGSITSHLHLLNTDLIIGLMMVGEELTELFPEPVKIPLVLKQTLQDRDLNMNMVVLDGFIRVKDFPNRNINNTETKQEANSAINASILNATPLPTNAETRSETLLNINEDNSSRLPALARLGPPADAANISMNLEHERVPVKKRLGRPPLTKNKPKALGVKTGAGTGTTKRRVAPVRVSPKRRSAPSSSTRGGGSKRKTTPQQSNSLQGNSLFRFDRRLKENPEIKALVGDTWKQAGNRDVQYKIGQTRRAIVLWNKEQQRNSKLLINKWKDELERAMTSPNNDSDLLNHINSELKSAYLEEEAFWKQRSRNLWLSLGDRNSGYFHAVTKGRNAVNNFSVIENADGEPVFTEKEITGTIVDYFKGLFTTVPGERKQIVTQAISPKISTLENKLFYKPHQQQKCTRRYLQFIRTKHQVRMGFLQVSSKLIGQLSEKILYLRSRSSSLPV
ncbi:hypothetical protein Bca52824_058138 [Brassica carinata]|uniref:Uncharacterized protein n=1 Tax=Brassica carinata TaxID=52824 RepID=A0A8X7QX98_BRACI|nr:hypothetical protein Bca52824_058138 [Brassica carinata]